MRRHKRRKTCGVEAILATLYHSSVSRMELLLSYLQGIEVRQIAFWGRVFLYIVEIALAVHLSKAAREHRIGTLLVVASKS